MSRKFILALVGAASSAVIAAFVLCWTESGPLSSISCQPNTPTELVESLSLRGLSYEIKQAERGEGFKEWHIKRSGDPRSWNELMTVYTPNKSKGHVIVFIREPGDQGAGVRFGCMDLIGDPDEIAKMMIALRQ